MDLILAPTTDKPLVNAEGVVDPLLTKTSPYPHALGSPSRTVVSSPSISTPGITPQNPLHPRLPGATGTSTSNSTPRLRSSIACARCRKSKIKCTNSGAGTTCEACAHSGRDCIYPAPGTGGHKREADGEDVARVKRSRIRKIEPSQAKVNVHFTIADESQENGRPRVRQDRSLSVRLDSISAPPLSPKLWNEVFELFQLHYGTELSFLHAPTFLPRLADDPAVYAAITGTPWSQDASSLEFLKLGMLALTARHHDGLVRQFRPHIEQTPTNESDSVSDNFAVMLKSLLFSGEAVEQPSIPKIQALLMLSLYEWSARKGQAAWLYLGAATRMAQAMDTMSEDLDISAASITTLTGSSSSSLLRVTKHEQHDLDSSEASIQEEIVRRTVWSCFVLDRYFSNGSFRSSSIDSRSMFVQMPCGEKAWAFGDRVCTPFFDGNCSHQKERIRRKLTRLNKIERKASFDERPSGTMLDSMISRIPCEYDEDEGLISRFVKLVDIWRSTAQWSYSGGKASTRYAPWDDRTPHLTLQAQLQRFSEELPRSLRFTKVNSQAHIAQHTSPPFTLLHTIYSISKLVILREFLPFAPVDIYSPSHLDDLEIREPHMYSRRWYSTKLAELFKVAHDFLDLIQTCNSRSLLPSGPMMGFGVYLVAFIGIYAIHFPQIDAEGLVFGSNMETNSRADRETKIFEVIEILATMRTHQPMVEYWFRVLHRAHRYYRYLSIQRSSTRLNRPRSSGTASDQDPLEKLDTIFQNVGLSEDEQVTYASNRESTKMTNGSRGHLSSPQPAWKPVNANITKYIDPLDRPAPQVGPQPQAKWYQARGDPLDPRKDSPGFDQTNSPYSGSHNILPPINPGPGPTAPGTARGEAGVQIFNQTSSPSISASNSNQSSQILCFSGEDVAIFVDARSDKELAGIREGWNIIKDGNDDEFALALGAGSPGHSRLGEVKKTSSTPGSGWLGILWQW